MDGTTPGRVPTPLGFKLAAAIVALGLAVAFVILVGHTAFGLWPEMREVPPQPVPVTGR